MGRRALNPISVRIGSPKASNNPIAPKQRQHATTTTTTIITHGSNFFGCGADLFGGVVMV